MNVIRKPEPAAENSNIKLAEAAKSAGDAWDRQEAEDKKKRMPSRRLMMIALPLVLVVGGAYVWVTGGRYQETENAYLQQPKVTIASEAAGRIIESHVTDNGFVHKGDVLFVVDPEPYRIALEQANAALADRAAESRAIARHLQPGAGAKAARRQ